MMALDDSRRMQLTTVQRQQAEGMKHGKARSSTTEKAS
jgi:hypothetical protein